MVSTVLTPSAVSSQLPRPAQGPHAPPPDASGRPPLRHPPGAPRSATWARRAEPSGAGAPSPPTPPARRTCRRALAVRDRPSERRLPRRAGHVAELVGLVGRERRRLVGQRGVRLGRRAIRARPLGPGYGRIRFTGWRRDRVARMRG